MKGRDAVVKVATSDLGDVFTVELSQREDGETWLIVENAILSEQEFAELPTEPRKRR